MKHLISILISSVCLLLCLSTVASADEGQPYFSLLGGLSLANDMNLSDNTGKYQIEFDSGYFVGGALGYDLGDSYPQLGKGRLELELGYRYSELKDAEFSTGKISAGGNLTVLSFMFNAIAEYEDFSPYYIPYGGLGLGIAQISLNDTIVTGSPMIDDDSAEFAFQFLAGLSFPIHENAAVDFGYRYLATQDPEFTDAQGRKVNADYSSNNFEIGLRINF